MPLEVWRTSRMVALAAAIAVSAGGCQPKKGAEAMLGDRAGTPGPASNGTCDFDLTGDKADTIFFVLGALDEYLGRYIVEGDDVVEKFRCTDDAAAIFRRQVTKLAYEQGIDPAMRDETQGECVLVYHSKVIADRLNTCYSYRSSAGEFATAADGPTRRVARPSLLIALFETGKGGSTTEAGWPDSVFHRRRALAYLAGAWMRYRRDKDFVFANSQSKAALVAELLNRLGCHQIRIEVTVGLIPQANIVHFEPTEEVKSWLAKTW